MNRVSFFAVHSLVHFALYVVPVTIFNLFFRWPICALEWAIGEKEITLAPRKERRIVIIKNCKKTAASDLFGLPSEMYYEEPMYVGCVQTLLAALRPQIHVPYSREILTLADGKSQLYIDCLSPINVSGKAFVLIIPGINASSQDVYVRRLSMQLYHHGYHVAVLNARDTNSDTPLYTQLLSDIQTEDLRYVLKHVFTPVKVQERMKAKEPRPLIAVGFTLGGVTLCKYIGEQGKRNECTYLTAAIAMLAPFDSNALHVYLQRTNMHMHMHNNNNNHHHHNNNIAGGDEQTVSQKEKQMEMVEHDINNNNNNSKKKKNNNRHNDDDNDELRAADGPHANMRAAVLPEKFNRSANVYRALHTATIPVMCVATQNDPLSDGTLHTRRWEAAVDVNANVMYVEMPSGGNLAFIENPIQELRRKPNAGEQLILQSLEAICAKN